MLARMPIGSVGQPGFTSVELEAPWRADQGEDAGGTTCSWTAAAWTMPSNGWTWAAWVKSMLGFSVEVVRRAAANTRGYWLPVGEELTEEQIKTFRGHRTFKVLRKRWVVERSFAWLSFDRRLNRDYDLLPSTTAAFIVVAFVRLMIRRLAAFAGEQPSTARK